MAVTIGGFSSPTLRAWQTNQTYGFEETDTREGMTAQQWTINGILTPAEWLDLLDEYNTWRGDTVTGRLADDPTSKILSDSPDIATALAATTTVLFSGDGSVIAAGDPGNQVWTNIPCWFSTAPSAEQVGAFLNVSLVLIDAEQALQVLAKEEEVSEEDSDLPDYGTYTINGVVLTLTKPIDAYGDGPALELTASGTHYINGPYVVEKIKDIEGTFDAATLGVAAADGDGVIRPVAWNNILSWYESQIIAVPTPGSSFPISIPTATAEKKIVSGTPTTIYTVSIQLGVVL